MVVPMWFVLSCTFCLGVVVGIATVVALAASYSAKSTSVDQSPVVPAQPND